MNLTSPYLRGCGLIQLQLPLCRLSSDLQDDQVGADCMDLGLLLVQCQYFGGLVLLSDAKFDLICVILAHQVPYLQSFRGT